MYTYSYSIPLKSNGDVLSVTIESERYGINYENFKNLSYLKKIIHSNTIRPRFRICLLNHDETVKYQIPNEDILAGGSYSENYQNGQRRSLSFSLINDDGKYTPSINSIWKNAKFSYEIGIEIEESGIIVWFKKGIFILKSANPSRNDTNATVSIECCDKFGFLESKSCTLSDTVSIETGIKIKEIINDILLLDIGNSYLIDTKPIIYDYSLEEKTTQVETEEQVGSTYGSLILQLADMMSAEVFYNSEGNLTFVPIIDMMRDGDKPVIDDYVDKDGDYQNNDFSFDFDALVNRVIVVGANINGAICRAEAINNNAESPLSIDKIGILTNVINDSNINMDIIAQERADYELRKSTILNISQSSSIFFNPLISVNDVITYSDEFYGLEKERFVVQSLSHSIGYDGIMSISNANINDLPFVNK